MKLPFHLQDEEHLVLLCRRHWVYLYPRLALILLAGAVPVVAFTWLVAATLGLDGPAGYGVIAADVAWGGYWVARLYFTWFRYNNDVWVVTNQRLVDSLRRHWFHHRMASADLVDVEDIAIHKEGVIPTLFNFGDLRCQTAGEQPNFLLSGIPDPGHALAVIDLARDAARRSLPGGAAVRD